MDELIIVKRRTSYVTEQFNINIGSYEKTLETLKEDPLAVVSDLLRIAEDYTA